VPTEVRMPGGLRLQIHLGSDDTGGAFCLLEDHPPEGWSLPPHQHLNESETVYVIEGEFESVVDGERRTLGPGEVVHIPAGVVHSGGGQGRRLLVFAPAGVERFFIEAASGGDLLGLAERYGWRFVA
jgi:mannose-6-phosphate isomerase-like protein (cupin superfamily)